MKLDTQVIGLAVGAGTAIAWTICSIFIALAPRPGMLLTGAMFHIPAESVTLSPTWAGFLIGLCVWTVTAGLFAALCATLYNRFGRE